MERPRQGTGKEMAELGDLVRQHCFVKSMLQMCHYFLGEDTQLLEDHQTTVGSLQRN